MSSDLVSTLENIQMANCGPVIIITAVGYDYFLTFSREIDYVWLRRWTWVSTLFVIVRYVGLCWAIILALIGTALVPGPIKLYVQPLMMPDINMKYLEGTVMFMVGDWCYVLFLAVADLVMILRVYAMWNQSRTILGILLFIYVPQIIISIVWEAIYSNPERTLSVMIGQALNSRYCDYSSNTAPSVVYRAIPRFVLGVALLILAFIPAFKESVEMYKVTKRWQTNRSMKLLAREGFVYFVVNLLFNIVNLIQWQLANVFLNGLSYSLSCAIMPRFIISIRELYHRDLRNRWQGIDTGFGVFSQSVASGDVNASVITFADVVSEQGQGIEDDADSSTARHEAVGV